MSKKVRNPFDMLNSLVKSLMAITSTILHLNFIMKCFMYKFRYNIKNKTFLTATNFTRDMAHSTGT